MVARWRLQLLAELSVGTAVRARAAAEDNRVRRLRSAVNGRR